MKRERLVQIREMAYEALAQPQEVTAVLGCVADRLALEVTAPVFYLLAQTSVLAALSSPESAGEITAVVHGNRLLWQRAS